MSIGSRLKDIYFRLEDSYYKLVERIDEHIPIYGIVERIDKVFPSFILFIIACVAVVALLSMFLLGLITPQAAILTVKVVDAEGSALPNAIVSATVAGKAVSAATDNFGEAKINAVLGSIALNVEKTGYEAKTETVAITQAAQSATITLASAVVVGGEKKIRLVNSVGQPVLERAVLSFSCSNVWATAPAGITVNIGEASVIVPDDCGKLFVSVVTDGYKNVDSFEVGDLPIYLEALEIAKGKIIVNLSYMGSAVSGVRVNLFSEAGIGPLDSSTAADGQAVLEVSAATYKVKTYDPNNVYGQAESQLVTVGVGEEVSVSLALEKSIAGYVQVKAIDKATRQGLAGAKVKLMEMATDDVVEILTTDADSNGVVKFNVADAGIEYKVVVDHADYLVAKLGGIAVSSSTYSVELERFTGQNGGTIKVKVVDEDGKAVQNATVVLYNADSGFLAGYGEKASDINGIAKFTRVQSGNYYGFAFKGSASGKSDAKYFDRRTAEETMLTAAMIVGDGTIRVKALDEEGFDVGFAMVSLYDAFDDSLIGSDYTDVNGVYEVGTKADKKVYVVVSREGKANYISSAKPVYPATVQAFTAVLRPRILTGEARIKFLGLYKGNLAAGTLSAGEEYVGKWELWIPEERDYSEAGVHLRTGSALIIEKDAIFIKEVNIPNTTIYKSTAYGTGYGSDIDAVTAEDAKWVEAVWQDPKAGVYGFEAVVKVKETASVSDTLNLEYRSWAIDDIVARDKECEVQTYDLYCDTYQQLYQVGVTTLCDESFCFDASITNLKEELIEPVVDSYSARIMNRYKLVFTITNNSMTKIHNSANLRMKNEDRGLLFDDYTIRDASGMTKTGSVNGYEFPWIDIGNFNPKSKISGTLYFTTKLAINSVFNMKIVSDMKAVYEKNLGVVISAAGQMSVEVEPEEYPSGIDTDLKVIVKDKATELELEGAAARVKDRHGNVLDLKTTNKSGEARLVIAAQVPGTKLTLEVEKQNYGKFTKELQIEAKVLGFSPESLGVGLNAKDKQESEDTLKVNNLTHFPVKITEMRMSGSFRGLIDLEKVNNWLYNYKDIELKEGKETEVKVKSYLSELGKGVKAAENLEGRLDITVSNFGQKWHFSVPVKISIGLGKDVQAGCMSISAAEWLASTEGNPVNFEFRLKNNCAVDGTPVALSSLKARIEFEGNEIGSYVVTLEDSGRELRSGYARLLSNTFDADSTKTGVITFSPNGGVNGVAKATVIFEAVNFAASGEQVLSDEIKTEISIVNLKDCITFDKELIDIVEGEKGSFSVATKECGGDTTLKFKTDLDLSKKEVTLKASDSSDAIEIMPQPGELGQYPIEVLVKGAGKRATKPIITLRVRIYPPKDSCLHLSRFEYDVYDDPNRTDDGFDTAEILNQCYDKEETAKIKGLRSWGDAMKEGLMWGLLTMVQGYVSQMFDPNAKAKAQGALGKAGGFSTAELDKLEKMKGNLKKINLKITELEKEKSNTSDIAMKDLIDQQIEELNGSRKSITDQIITQTKKTSQAKSGADKFRVSSAVGTSLTTPKYTRNVFNVKPNYLDIKTKLTSTAFRYDAGGFENLGNTVFYKNTVTGTYEIWKPSGNGWSGEKVEQEVWKNEKISAASTIPWSTTSATLPAIPTTGEFNLGGSSGSGGGGMFGEMFGLQLMSSLVDSVTGASKNPMGAGLGAFLMSTMISYYGQQDTAEARVVQRDVILGKYGVYEGDAEDSAFTAAEDANPSIESKGTSLLNIEKRSLVVRNAAQKEGVFYRTFKLEAKRNVYDSDASYKKSVPDVLNIKEVKDMASTFRIQLNAVAFDENVTPFLPPETVSCRSSTRTGITGKNALPKVKFDWDWQNIGMKDCDMDNENGVYCDATQFSIAVLKKVELIRQFVENNAPFTCPSAETALSTKTQSIPNYDTGISLLEIKKSGRDANIVVNVENTNPTEVSYDLNITIIESATGSQESCIKNGERVLSKADIGCVFISLGDGTYEVKAKIIPDASCENCENNSNTDSLNSAFMMGQSGLEMCEPYSTARLGDFIAASEAAGKSFTYPSGVSGKEEMLKLVSFRAYLMQDRYSSDFHKDFDDYATTISFFNAPSYYIDAQTGLGRYFKDIEKFKFVPNYGEVGVEGYLLPGPGVYNVDVNITFEPANPWQFFDINKELATVRIILDKADVPLQQNPFYYLPVDGLIGADNERIGYGINYSGESIALNADEQQRVNTVDISGSTPVPNGVLQTSVKSDLAYVNNTERGVLLSLSKAGNSNPSMVYSPSYATPVIMKITSERGDAYAFYSVDSGGAQNTGFYMTEWTGIGYNCKAFDGSSVIEQLYQTKDVHGLNSECAILGATEAATSYGLEWCSAERKGNVYAKSVFYTPQGRENTLNAVVANDNATFITPASTGSAVSLNGISGMRYNQHGASMVASVENVFDLVKDELVCVTNTGSRVDFWWNPKPVVNAVESQEKAAESSCIS